MHASFVPALSRPTTLKALVALADQARFAQNTRGRPSAAVFADLNDFYRLVETAVEASGGLVIKFMGDAALIVFPEALAGDGIMALLRLKGDADAWFRARGIDSVLHVNAHFGEVTMGKMGSIDRLDIIGETVNICATLPHRGFTLSPQAFRCLRPDDRRLFHRFTPPVTYHPEGM
jgi:class 3 adenylate cyclase